MNNKDSGVYIDGTLAHELNDELAKSRGAY
jgi:hypothetical protein